MRNKKTQSIIKIYSDLYHFTVVFVIGPKPSDAFMQKIARRHLLWSGNGEPVYIPKGARASTSSFGTGCLVWLRHGNMNTAGALGLFSHELVHVLTNFADCYGQGIKFQADEMHAYYAQWLSDQFVRKSKALR